MKKLFFAMMLGLSLMTFVSCDKDDDSTEIEATILGRWVPEGFEDNIRYDFTADKRYTIYATDGVFPSLEDFIAANPGVGENDWSYEGETVVIDLNFGNFSRIIPEFTCDNFVVNWSQESDGSDGGRYYREGFDISGCN